MKFAQERIGIEGFYNLKALQALDVLKFDNLVLVFASMIGLWSHSLKLHKWDYLYVQSNCSLVRTPWLLQIGNSL